MLFLDTETFSTVDINRGLDAYAQGVEILLVAYAVDDGPVQVCDITLGEPPPEDLETELLHRPEELVVMHNSVFDLRVLEEALAISIPLERVVDTMVLAAQHALPLQLGALGEALGYDEDRVKIKDGRRLINLFCKPQPKGRKLARATRETHPEEWARFIDYARRDVEVMRDIYHDLPRWNDTAREREIWEVDQRINRRGIAVDEELARAAVRAVALETKQLDELVTEASHGLLSSARQRDKVLAYVRDSGVALPNLQAATLTEALAKGEVPSPVRRILQARAAAGSTSVAKYQVVLDAVVGGRLRYLLQYGGAMRTLRWSGRLVQPQNLPRPTFKPKALDEGISALLLDVADLLYDNVTELVSSAVRGVFVAEAGKKLLVADYSSIEGRALAWLAGEHWKVEAYADGEDLYVMSFAATFGVDVDKVTKLQRQIGKVMELALGYQGALGAWYTMAKGYGVHELVDREALRAAYPAAQVKTGDDFETYVRKANDEAVYDIVRRWRAANPMIVKFWADLDRAVRQVLDEKKRTGGGRLLGPVQVRGIRVDTVEHLGWTWLRLRLPSGRYLSYPRASLEHNPETDKTEIRYWGIHQITRQWVQLTSYGGKFAENITQAVARDLLADALVRCEERDFPVVLHVHDEVLTEVDDAPLDKVEDLIDAMTQPPGWAKGLPLAAAGFETYRYRKE